MYVFGGIGDGSVVFKDVHQLDFGMLLFYSYCNFLLKKNNTIIRQLTHMDKIENKRKGYFSQIRVHFIINNNNSNSFD